jgi:hypothetical protein
MLPGLSFGSSPISLVHGSKKRNKNWVPMAHARKLQFQFEATPGK